MSEFAIGSRVVGRSQRPLVIAEIGINHEGSLDKALRMVEDAARAGCECVKFQCHVPEDEMVPNEVVPANANESIWNMMNRCALSANDERRLMDEVQSRGMIFLSTPFSRAAADRLRDMGVAAFKIGSGECNNYPLVRHIAAFGKPVLLSTGMNDIGSVAAAAAILRQRAVPFALLHCTSMYPTPYQKVRLGALAELAAAFPDAVIGLSDHSVGIWTCLGAVALGAAILEKHFTSDPAWPGPDIPISITPTALAELIMGADAIHTALGGSKEVLPEEAPTIKFAYASVVAVRAIRKGERLGLDNIWVKRPGTGDIPAAELERVIGWVAARDIPCHTQLAWSDMQR